MRRRVGWRCPCKDIVGIYGSRWACWDIIGDLGRGRRQGVSLLIIVSRGCMSKQPKDNQKTRFGEEGQGRLVESRVYNRGHIMRVKSPQKINKKSASKKRKRNDNERTANKHRHTYKNTKVQCIIYVRKTQKQAKTKQKKFTTPKQCNY